MPRVLIVVIALAAVFVTGCGRGTAGDPPLVRLGYFPNITHAQALIGMAPGRQDFQKAFGKEIGVDPKVFNAGPSAIEALFAGELDITYIGPNPAINGFVRSKGRALRVVAGATSGGAVLVVRRDIPIRGAADLDGRRNASPQLANTKDIALRFYLADQKLLTRERGGTVTVIPAQNPDILTLLIKQEIDAAWVPEPWGARLVKEGGARILLDERDLWPDRRFVTANVVVSTDFLEKHPELVERFLRVHVDLTLWIQTHQDEARRTVNQEIARLTGKALAEDVLVEAWSRIDLTYDPLPTTLFTSADRAYSLGFLGKDPPDLREIYALAPLNRVLRTRGLPEIPTPDVQVVRKETEGK